MLSLRIRLHKLEMLQPDGKFLVQPAKFVSNMHKTFISRKQSNLKGSREDLFSYFVAVGNEQRMNTTTENSTSDEGRLMPVVSAEVTFT